MTRKHFVGIAAIVKRSFDALDVRMARRPKRTDYTDGYDAGYVAAAETLALDLAEYFGTVNEHFDRARFESACGL
mgnify:CR=1 FL=1